MCRVPIDKVHIEHRDVNRRTVFEYTESTWSSVFYKVWLLRDLGIPMADTFAKFLPLPCPMAGSDSKDMLFFYILFS